jgi:uncharacterized protein YukE
VYAWYQTAYSKCRVPIFYDIGTIDPRFNIKTDAVKSALADAESVWEDATGKNLFTYKKGAALKVDFVYDERQRSSNEQRTLVATLDEKAGMSASIKKQYDALSATYKNLKSSYESNLATYDAKLAAHNALVESWNQKGGAPRAVFAQLQKTSIALNAESADLNSLAKNLNNVAAKINEVGDAGNKAVADYNKDVASFNAKYSKTTEFTEGDYQRNVIHVYQYDNLNELRRVLAHELGHALSLDHVDDIHAIMHAVLATTKEAPVATDADLAEYRLVCGTR